MAAAISSAADYQCRRRLRESLPFSPLRLPVSVSRSEPRTSETQCRVRPGYMSRKFESFKRMNSIRVTNGYFDSCTSCKRLAPAVYLSRMSQNVRLLHVPNLSVRNFRIFLLMYPGSVFSQNPGSALSTAGSARFRVGTVWVRSDLTGCQQNRNNIQRERDASSSAGIEREGVGQWELSIDQDRPPIGRTDGQLSPNSRPSAVQTDTSEHYFINTSDTHYLSPSRPPVPNTQRTVPNGNTNPTHATPFPIIILTHYTVHTTHPPLSVFNAHSFHHQPPTTTRRPPPPSAERHMSSGRKPPGAGRPVFSDLQRQAGLSVCIYRRRRRRRPTLGGERTVRPAVRRLGDVEMNDATRLQRQPSAQRPRIHERKNLKV